METDGDWRVAREGIQLLLNNKITEAEQLFGDRKDNVQMAAGYCFVTFMAFRVRVFGATSSSSTGGGGGGAGGEATAAAAAGEAERLEQQVILADSQVRMAEKR
ncbi:Uncharacterized protein GBIM_15558 [Gryllus bimaculatus]|nr:Uncharacterized protein GBIM_15558 [Gryllus bimaculatus]